MSVLCVIIRALMQLFSFCTTSRRFSVVYDLLIVNTVEERESSYSVKLTMNLFCSIFCEVLSLHTLFGVDVFRTDS